MPFGSDIWRYPDVGFHFLVTFIDTDATSFVQSTITSTVLDSSWSEVSGLMKELSTEELVEGGENRFTHKLPQRGKFSNLILKRGYFALEPSAVVRWANDAINNLNIRPWQVQVSLLNEYHVPVSVWVFTNAYPVKVGITDLKAIDNTFLIESLELTYQYFRKVALDI